MTYVRCIRNETLWDEDPAPTYDPLLIVGNVYKVAPPDVNVSKPSADSRRRRAVLGVFAIISRFVIIKLLISACSSTSPPP